MGGMTSACPQILLYSSTLYYRSAALLSVAAVSPHRLHLVNFLKPSALNYATDDSDNYDRKPRFGLANREAYRY